MSKQILPSKMNDVKMVQCRYCHLFRPQGATCPTHYDADRCPNYSEKVADKQRQDIYRK